MSILVRRCALEDNVWRPAHLALEQMEERRLAAARLLRNISGDGDVAVTGNPVLARVHRSDITMLEPEGLGCTLYAAAFEELASLYLGKKTAVVHERCAAKGDSYCEWRLDVN